MTRLALVIGLMTMGLNAVAADDDTRNGMPLLVSVDFTSGADNWEFTDPNAWTVQEDGGRPVLALTGPSKYEPPVRSPLSIALLKGVTVSNFVLEAEVRQTGREYGHRDFCVFFGHQDPSRFYYTHLATQADAHANSVFLVNDEPRVSIAKERTDGTTWTDGYHLLRVVRDTASGKIEVFFDDMEKPVMVAEDSTFTWGRVGFGSFDDTGNVAAVRLWGVKAEPEE
jgi:hypothetical protein